MTIKLTNKDNIQAMETWALAEFLHKVSNNEIQITTCNNECAKCESSDGWCISNIAEWLNDERR